MDELRKRHNQFKRDLIEYVTCPGAHVLDVGSGRGGDLQKWKARDPGGINMCEPDAESLEEAKRRAKNLKIRVNFYHGDIHAAPKRAFDIICYNFSLHYIFESRDVFERSVKAIRARAKKGTILCGIVPDSQRITMRVPVQDDLGNFFVTKRPSNGDFGEHVFVNIADGPYYEDGAKKEPIAHKDRLVTALEANGFALKTWEPLFGSAISELYSKFIFVYIR